MYDSSSKRWVGHIQQETAEQARTEAKALAEAYLSERIGEIQWEEYWP